MLGEGDGGGRTGVCGGGGKKMALVMFVGSIRTVAFATAKAATGGASTVGIGGHRCGTRSWAVRQQSAPSEVALGYPPPSAGRGWAAEEGGDCVFGVWSGAGATVVGSVVGVLIPVSRVVSC